MTHLYTKEYFELVAESWRRRDEWNKTPPPEKSGHGIRGRFIWEPLEVKDEEVVEEDEAEDEGAEEEDEEEEGKYP